MIDFATKKGVTALASSAGSGLTVIILKCLEVYWPDSSIAQLLEDEVIAVLTGFLTFSLYIIFMGFKSVREDFGYWQNVRTLKKMIKDDPENQTAKNSLAEIQAKKATRLSKI